MQYEAQVCAATLCYAMRELSDPAVIPSYACRRSELTVQNLSGRHANASPFPRKVKLSDPAMPSCDATARLCNRSTAFNVRQMQNWRHTIDRLFKVGDPPKNSQSSPRSSQLLSTPPENPDLLYPPLFYRDSADSPRGIELRSSIGD